MQVKHKYLSEVELITGRQGELNVLDFMDKENEDLSTVAASAAN